MTNPLADWVEIIQEAADAHARYGDFTSTHEALGVLTEEMDELLEAVRSNDLGAVALEARQVAAVAARLCRCARENTKAFAPRSHSLLITTPFAICLGVGT